MDLLSSATHLALPKSPTHWRGLDSDSQTPRYDAICELIGRSDSVLDVGCGEGVLLGRLRDRGHSGRYLGIEQDRNAATAGWERFGSAIQHTTERDYVPDRQWDVVVMSEMLYYLPDPVATLRRYIGFVHTGGRAIVTMYLRPGRPRWKALFRSIFNPRFPCSALHCANLVSTALRSSPGVTTRDIAPSTTSLRWRMWVITAG